MAQRNQIGRALRALNGGDAGDAEHVAFLCRAGANQCQRFRLHPDGAARDGDAMRAVLAADVNHVGLSGAVEMGEFCHESMLKEVCRHCPRKG